MDKNMVEESYETKKDCPMEDVELSEEDRLQEEQYNKKVRLLKSMSCMDASKSKIELCKDLVRFFKEKNDYKESKDYVKKCTDLQKKTQKDYKLAQYTFYCEQMERAKTEADFENVKKSFTKLKEYKDSPDRVQQCDMILKKTKRKDRISSLRHWSYVAIIILIFALFKTNIGQYTVARVCNKITWYAKAADLYDGLGKYKDSKARYKEAIYNQAKRMQERGNLEEAQELYYACVSYRDSAQRLLVVEDKLIQNAQVGDEIPIGDATWIILDKQANEVLCIKKKAIKNIPYATVAQDMTWEESQIRHDLNTTFIQETFTEEEQSRITRKEVITEDNMLYQTKGGNTTQDKIFLLSKEEVERYEEILSSCIKRMAWLRTPGGLQQATSVYNGTVLNEYGRLATDQNIAAYPAFWFSSDMDL
ncbi:DUF6273 domain-containing protein [Anaerosporobacter faecicola]|uniref:DUF6273 domain-containing protein n=1 Tax=Anaerosporobacter faecicola TaxID=2718714 RepID=UPI001438BA01|nr:DUF6273 domain-containing protein [Anaerosporobacter faecicola]